MAHGWRQTIRMVAAAAAATAVTRAAESVRRMLEEAATPELGGPVSKPEPLQFLEAPMRLTAAGAGASVPGSDQVIAAQADRPHDYGPAPVVVPSRGIGFRSEPTRRADPVVPAAEMPVISRPSGAEPDEPEPLTVEVTEALEPVIVEEPVRTAAAIVKDLEAVPDSEDAAADAAATAPEAEEPHVRALRLTPPADEPVDQPVDKTVDEPIAAPELHRTPPPVETTPPGPEVAVAPPADDTDEQSGSGKGKHRRHRGAISGTVRSSRGRALRGMRIAALDDDKRVVATAVTGTGGAFVVEGLPVGAYRLRARDDDDSDFAKSWHDGSSFASAGVLKVKHGKTRRDADVVLMAEARIETEVDIRKKKVVVAVRVTDRATGAPAKGRLRLSTKLFATELSLDKGRATITLYGAPSTTGKKLAIDYLGAKHTGAASHVVRLR